MAWPLSFAYESGPLPAPSLPPPSPEEISAILAASIPQWPAPEIRPTEEVYPPVGPIGPIETRPIELNPNLRRITTGDSTRFVDVPAIIAANAARFAPPQPLFVRPVIQPQLPPILKTIAPIETGASRMIGYDPNNPPSVHTLSPSQFMSLSPLMREQYLAQAEARAQAIEDVRKRRIDIANVAIEATLRKQEETNKIQRESQDAANIAQALNAAETQKAQLQIQVDSLDKIVNERFPSMQATPTMPFQFQAGTKDNPLLGKVVFQPPAAATTPAHPSWQAEANRLTQEYRDSFRRLEKATEALRGADEQIKQMRTLAGQRGMVPDILSGLVTTRQAGQKMFTPPTATPPQPKRRFTVDARGNLIPIQ